MVNSEWQKFFNGTKSQMADNDKWQDKEGWYTMDDDRQSLAFWSWEDGLPFPSRDIIKCMTCEMGLHLVLLQQDVDAVQLDLIE